MYRVKYWLNDVNNNSVSTDDYMRLNSVVGDGNDNNGTHNNNNQVNDIVYRHILPCLWAT